jgi:outer membrane protein TolC
MSLFISVDIPLFTTHRQDKRVSAAQHNVGAGRADRDLVLRQFEAENERLIREITFTQQRLDSFDALVLSQALTRLNTIEHSYKNGVANYAEVIAAADSVLTLNMALERIKADLHLQYNQQAFYLNRYF